MLSPPNSAANAMFAPSGDTAGVSMIVVVFCPRRRSLVEGGVGSGPPAMTESEAQADDGEPEGLRRWYERRRRLDGAKPRHPKRDCQGGFRSLRHLHDILRDGSALVGEHQNEPGDGDADAGAHHDPPEGRVRR